MKIYSVTFKLDTGAFVTLPSFTSVNIVTAVARAVDTMASSPQTNEMVYSELTIKEVDSLNQK